MTTLTRKKNKLTWHDVLRSVQMLSPQDQRRLRDELAKSAGVYLVRPTGNAATIRRGRRLAKTIQAELTAASMDSLDETIQDQVIPANLDA
jgi:hypothetical protein